MVNPGGFSGLRKAFLDDQQAAYNAAVEAKNAADTLADIQRRYFKRFPVSLLHSEDPTEEFLASVDDNAPDPELSPPDRANMDSVGYDRAKRVYELQVIEIKMRKAQIKRRLQYVYNKAKNDKTTFEMGSNDPMAILMSKLTGNSLQRPRMKTPYNLWGPNNRCFVDPVFAERVKEGNVSAKGQAALRSAIYKELFEELPEDERREWAERAEREHQQALDNVNDVLKSGPSAAPADRQRIIECLPRFLQPILDMIADHTGWKITLLAGGPEPADGGRLNVVSVHSGVTSGSVKMNFGRSERVSYSDVILPVFGKFLRKCYSIQECRDRALPNGSEFAGLAEVGNQEGFDVHALDDGSREADGYVRMAAPGLQTPSLGARATSSSARRSASTSKQMAGSTSAAQPTPLRSQPPEPMPIIKVPVALKFGPPKGKRRNDMHDHPLIEEGESRTASVEKVGGPGHAASAGAACASRGPTPPTSRLSTPIPAVNGSPPLHSEAPAPAIGPSDAECAPPPATALVRRAASAQPMPSVPAFANTSAVRAQSATPSVRAQPVTMEVRHSDVAPTFVAPAFSAAAASATPTPSAPTPSAPTPSVTTPSVTMPSATTPSVPTPIQQNMDFATSANGVDLGLPHAAEAPRASVANLISSVSHHLSTAANAAVNPPSAEYTSPARRPPSIPNSAASSAPSAAKQGTAAVAPPQLLAGSIAVPDFEKDVQVEARRSGRKRKGAAHTTPAPKRRKLLDEGPIPSTSGAADTPSVGGADAQPVWVVNALCLLQSVPLGPEWDNLLRSWLQFEQDAGFEDGPRLGARHRPSLVADWIQYARKPNHKYEIKNPNKFAEEFEAWWRGLQPDWRLDDASDLLRRDGDDWECLRRSGVNGLLSVLAGLFFWGRHAQRGTAPFKLRWSAALEDVLYAIDRLL